MKTIAFFEIPGLPKTINAIGRAHWGVKVKEAKHWKRLVMEQCVYHKIAGLLLNKAVLVLGRYSARETDFDNLASSFKHVLDGLVEAKVIVDDKPSIIGSPTFIWHKAPPKRGKITIEILVES